MLKAGALSVENAWNAVALEERLELVSQAKAEGVFAAFVFMLMMGAVGYGFDNILLLPISLLLCFMVVPLFASFAWRREKPKLILSYLAVRSIARRYAFGYRLHNFDVVLIFKGTRVLRYSSRDEEEFARQQQTVDFNTQVNDQAEVWIVLMRGGLVLLSERPGGAKLEYITPINADSRISKPSVQDEALDGSLLIQGAGNYRGKDVLISSPYSGAMYVFERQFSRLLSERQADREKADRAKRLEAETA